MKALRLDKTDQRTIRLLLKRGRERAAVLRRAQILLLAHKGYNRKAIIKVTEASTSTVGRTKRWYREQGLDAAIYDSERSGRPKKMDAKTKAILIATACSDPPEGYSRWTYELIASHAPIGKRISGESVRLMMKADGLKPWREKNVVYSDAHRHLSGADVYGAAAV